ncbi:hypothetical protein HGB07_00240 [Candidatus Roizmanbacteria bacterium]|nr:hypothetical protein [Candidatus Roizmanbacteria bacterium]
MHKGIGKICFTVLSVIFLCSTMTEAADKILSLVSGSGASTIEATVGDLIAVEVRINDATIVAGASFAITYDTTKLSLSSVASTFFNTFTNQSIPTPNNQGYVTVDSTNYYSPIVKNPFTTGTMLAAARVNNGTGANQTLFTLNFQFIGNSGTLPLTMPVTISQSIINNTNAGYNSAGEAIPFLVGIIEGTPDTYRSYPTLPGPTNVVTINPCNIVVNAAFVDTDGDGIDDNWEMANVPAGTDPSIALNVFFATGDYDRDGYTDLQEYLNSLVGDGKDPQGIAYDPKVKNAPNGIGYTPIGRNTLPAIMFLLLGQ